MIEGIDCASTIHDPAALKAAGKHFACRYLSTSGNPKNLGLREARNLSLAGIEVVTVFETTADRALAGHAAGQADALSADTQAKVAGAPDGVPIYFAVDFDMQPSQASAVRSYFEGCVAAIGAGRVGGYGGRAVIAMLHADKTCKYLWQTYAWSGTPTQWVAGAQLQQYHNGVTVAGVSCDLDRALVADYGQWDRPVPKRHWPKPDHWGLDYTDVAGKPQHIKTKHPGIWQARHRHARDRGKVVITPVFHPIKK